ncbi:probable transmembrane ascorbate ferrireductase 4 [Cajanus cajan]|uniref:probable transmembrane ascorbate ferrireductase 4 n=1 Tax=Cajanus cajan TaxID=3821 RepID=UPI00098D8E7C|nr:probable transmembrane ascorbate ferrireductase 4 [Cajanus cajan]
MATQWLIGFLNFWHRGEVRTVRIRILPWHVFLGLYTYALAIATAETGLLEKLTFLQTKRNVAKHSTESMVVNSLGLVLALLSGFVILAAVSPKYWNDEDVILPSKHLQISIRTFGAHREVEVKLSTSHT